MGRKCCVCGEVTSKYTTISFHSFPGDPEYQMQWIHFVEKSLGNTFMLQKNSFICSKHFDHNDFEQEAFGHRKLKPAAIPNKFREEPFRITIIQTMEEFDKTSQCRVDDEGIVKQKTLTAFPSTSSHAAFVKQRTVKNKNSQKSFLSAEMGRKCCVCGESQTKTATISFHKFPANPKRYKIWTDTIRKASILGSDFVIDDTSLICSKHFDAKSFHLDNFKRIKLRANANPIIFNAEPTKIKCVTEAESICGKKNIKHDWCMDPVDHKDEFLTTASTLVSNTETFPQAMENCLDYNDDSTDTASSEGHETSEIFLYTFPIETANDHVDYVSTEKLEPFGKQVSTNAVRPAAPQAYILEEPDTPSTDTASEVEDQLGKPSTKKVIRTELRRFPSHYIADFRSWDKSHAEKWKNLYNISRRKINDHYRHILSLQQKNRRLIRKNKSLQTLLFRIFDICSHQNGRNAKIYNILKKNRNIFL